MSLSVFETRRENLRRLVLDKYEGKRSLFSRASGVQENQINLLLTDNATHRRNLGEALARRIEEALGLAIGYMDQPQASEELHPIPCLEVPPALRHIFRTDDDLEKITVRPHFLAALAGKITSPVNLTACLVATDDMSPSLKVGDHVVVDAAVKAVSADGVYVLQHSDTVFLRRVCKLLAGGWGIESGAGAVQHFDSLKGFKVLSKVVMTLRTQIL